MKGLRGDSETAFLILKNMDGFEDKNEVRHL
jgi:hypothetical protein